MAASKKARGRQLLLVTAAALAAVAARARAEAGALGYYETGSATATFYGGGDASGTWGGNCGYGNLVNSGYGLRVSAGSAPLFKGGLGCGACYRVQCAGSQYCSGNSIVVPITDFCPGGGWCEATSTHFDMSQPGFAALADVAAGAINVTYQRVPCAVQNNIRLLVTGNPYWLNLLIENVGGPGDVALVEVKPAGADSFVPMTHSWGANWDYPAFLQGPLAFRLTSLLDGQTVTSGATCLPDGWALGTYDCGLQFSYAAPAPPPLEAAEPPPPPRIKGHHKVVLLNRVKGHHKTAAPAAQKGHHIVAPANRVKGHHKQPSTPAAPSM